MATRKNSDAGNDTSGDVGSIGSAIESSGGTDVEIGGIKITNPADATGSSVGSADPGSSNNSGSAKRGRGRPAGSGKSKQQKAAPVSVKGIEQLLFTIHLGLVKITGIDELEIDKEEAKLLSEAVTEVSSHYNVVVDPKTVAWLGLLGVCGTVYGPRFGAYKLRKQIEKDAKDKSENDSSNLTLASVNNYRAP